MRKHCEVSAKGKEGKAAMKFHEFMGALRKGTPHVFLLAGEEQYYVEKALAALRQNLFPDGGAEDAVENAPGEIDVDQLIGLIETVPFFAEKHVVIVRDAPFFKAANAGKKADGPGEKQRPEKKRGKDAKQERLQQLLQDMPPFAYVIFLMKEKPDQRRKLTKLVEQAGLFLDAEPVRPWNINEWLQGKLRDIGKEMDREAHEYFLGAVSMMQQISLSYLDQEFDKIALFSRQPRITKAEMIEVFSGLPETSVFALIDAVSAKDVKKALALLVRQLQDGTYFAVLLALLARHVRQLWQARLLMAQGCYGRQLAKKLELNPYIAEKLGRAAKRFRDDQLRQAYLAIVDADYRLKTGQGGNELLERILIVLCR